MYIDEPKVWEDFHDLWTSCVGRSKYFKGAWTELQKVLTAAILTKDSLFVEEVLVEARQVQVSQLELH